jgi:hypothetical protein
MKNPLDAVIVALFCMLEGAKALISHLVAAGIVTSETQEKFRQMRESIQQDCRNGNIQIPNSPVIPADGDAERAVRHPLD